MHSHATAGEGGKLNGLASADVADDKGQTWWIYRADLARYLEEMKALGSDKHNWRRLR